jgi:hypothetical protein
VFSPTSNQQPLLFESHPSGWLFSYSCLGKLARSRRPALFATIVSYATAQHKLPHALKRLVALSLLIIGSCSHAQSTEPSVANDSARWYLTVSPYTKHYYPKPIHSHVWLVGIERHDTDNSFMGAAFFNNSFGQNSVYLYPWGQSYPNFWSHGSTRYRSTTMASPQALFQR